MCHAGNLLQTASAKGSEEADIAAGKALAPASTGVRVADRCQSLTAEIRRSQTTDALVSAPRTRTKPWTR
jgi:hypothetical protein